MPAPKNLAAALAGSPDDVENAFYAALQNADADQLMACWSDEDDIVCIHPSGGRLVGAAAIRASFEAIFANGAVPAWPERIRRIESLDSAVHNVLERVEVATPEGLRQAYAIATNVYHKTAQGWRMVAHHASPGTAREQQEAERAPQTLH